MHVLVVVHGVGSTGRCLRWDQFASQRVLGARVAAIAVAWTCWPAGHDPLVLEPALFNGAWGFSRFAVLFFANCLIALLQRARVRARGAARLGLGGLTPRGHGQAPTPSLYTAKIGVPSGIFFGGYDSIIG